MHCLYCYVISYTQQVTTWANTSFHLLLLKSSMVRGRITAQLISSLTCLDSTEPINLSLFKKSEATVGMPRSNPVNKNCNITLCCAAMTSVYWYEPKFFLRAKQPEEGWPGVQFAVDGDRQTDDVVPFVHSGKKKKLSRDNLSAKKNFCKFKTWPFFDVKIGTCEVQ